jgi:hypothetical protein
MNISNKLANCHEQTPELLDCMVRETVGNFFTARPHLLLQLCYGYPCHNPWHVEIWEEIFCYVYGEGPISAESQPDSWRLGSSDPRWDKLVRAKEGYGFPRFVEALIQEHMNSDISREAA